MAEGGLAGGALYDGLVGATARQHKLSLVSCDRRAEPTYRLLGVEYELLSRTPR
jgi:predicted nucleic acid-binding protein